MSSNSKATLAQLVSYAASVKEQIKKRAAEEGGAYLSEILKPIFEYDERITAVRWHQYTPYFNDGEPCVFGVNFGYIWIEGLAQTAVDASDDGDGYITPWTLTWIAKNHSDYFGEDKDKFTIEWVKELDERVFAISRLMRKPYYHKEVQAMHSDGSLEELMLMMFGDHVTVTITKDSVVTVEEYDHD